MLTRVNAVGGSDFRYPTSPIYSVPQITLKKHAALQMWQRKTVVCPLFTPQILDTQRPLYILCRKSR